MKNAFERQWIEVDGLRLRVVDTGLASPHSGAGLPLLIIPGHTARIEGFDEMMPALSAHRRVIVVDMPGSGESDKPNRTYDLEFYEDTLIAVLDHLGIERAIPFGGSLGGNLVLRLGHRFPQRFPVLVLWAPGGGWKAKPWLASATRFLGSSPFARAAFWLSVRIQSRFWYSPDFVGRQRALDETFAYYRRVLCPGFIAMYWGMAGDQLGHSLFSIAADIEQPTLLMWGDRDHGAGMGKGVAKLAELLPNNELVVFEGARHSIETEIPDQLSVTALRYLAEQRV